MVAVLKADYKLAEKILELVAQGVPKKDIPKILRVGRTTVFKVLKEYRVPEIITKKESKKVVNINEIISTRLLYFCDDLELISKRMAIEIIAQNPEKIIIPSRLANFVKKEKMSKVVNILDRINLDCKLEYARI